MEASHVRHLSPLIEHLDRLAESKFSDRVEDGPVADSAYFLCRYLATPSWNDFQSWLLVDSRENLSKHFYDLLSDLACRLTAITSLVDQANSLGDNGTPEVRGAMFYRLQQAKLLGWPAIVWQARFLCQTMSNLKLVCDLVEDQHFSDPKSPAEWSARFGKSWKTISRDIKKGAIPAKKVTGQQWRIHNASIPPVIKVDKSGQARV